MYQSSLCHWYEYWEHGLPGTSAWIGTATCGTEVLVWGWTKVRLGAHAARVALVAKGGTTPVLVLDRVNEGQNKLI